MLSRPGQPVDTLTGVDWLQGPSLYVDLRQPPISACQVAASCLAELQLDEALALAAQEGFAGTFALVGDEAEWLREIDFQPAAPLGDRGRLVAEGDLLIEHGIEADYVEYWQREPAGGATERGQRQWAARLIGKDDGRLTILVRHGNHFAYARDRGVPLARGQDLAVLLIGKSAEEARVLVDCEIAQGTIFAEGWRIERSTLPWRQGALLLGPGAGFAGELLDVNDMTTRGLPTIRRLRLLELGGEADFAPMPGRVAPPIAASASSPAFERIPVVDISALGTADAAAEAAAVEQLREAAAGVGFLHITGHGIAPAVIERLRDAAQRFFALPEKVKFASYIGHSSNHRGYVPEGEEIFAAGLRDRKEAFDIALDLPSDSVPPRHPMLGPNQWPQLAGFREDVMAYYAAAFAVGRRLLRGFAMALGRPADSFDHLVTMPPSQLRLVHYPFSPEAEDAPGIGAHTDYECFTLLLADKPGLEVMNRAGVWIDAPPVPGAIVVNIGDMMEFWSGGAFVATSHRVRKVAEERYSFPLFFALDYDVDLRPLGDRAARPIRTGEHLYAQTVQTFRYLQERARADGRLLSPQPCPQASFGQAARHSRQTTVHQGGYA